MQQEVTIQSQSATKGFNWSDFLSFRKMITLQVESETGLYCLDCLYLHNIIGWPPANIKNI